MPAGKRLAQGMMLKAPFQQAPAVLGRLGLSEEMEGECRCRGFFEAKLRTLFLWLLFLN